MIYRYKLDVEKLFNAMDGKRRSTKLSWQRLAFRLGLKDTTIIKLTRKRPNQEYKTISADTFIPILIWLDRPITDFVITTTLGGEDADSEE